jgi:endonuclease/exonuclease/phosphatase family metal-dependent hydrolase
MLTGFLVAVWLAASLSAWTGRLEVSREPLAHPGYRATYQLPLRFSVATYNVQARPMLDRTTDKFPAIAPLLGEFDIVAVQECFKDHRRLWRGTGHTVRVYDGIRTDWLRFAASGLTTLSRFPLATSLSEKFREPEGFRSRLRGKRDGLVSKGVLLTRFDLGHRITIDFYNTHMEAGSDAISDEARRLQTLQIIDFIKTHSPERHMVIVAGDFNMRPAKKNVTLPPNWPATREVLNRSQLLAWLMRELQLTNAGTSVGGTAPDLIDHILYRSSSTHELRAIAWQREKERFHAPDGSPWSDHDPVTATFRVTARP